MARIPSAVLAAALLLLPLRSEGSEFWDAHYRAGDNARSLELHRRLLIEGPHDGIAGLDEDASRAVWEEAHLRFILELTREQRSYGEARATLEGFLEKEHPPLLDALARQNLASYRWLLHDLAGARSTWRELAFLTDWWIIGSFENERGSGLSRRYPPEEGFDPDAVYRGKRHDVTWRRWSDPGRAGLVELGSLLRPPEEAVAYLLTHLHAPEPTEAVLRIGSSGSYALWLNGREAARRDVERRLHFDQDAVVVRLEEGWNRLLVKSGQTKGSWRFRARLSRRDGAPLAGIRILAALPEGASLAEAGGPLPPQDAPLGAVTLLAEAEPSAESLHLLGWLLRARGAHDVTEHPDRGAHLRALELEPGSAVGEHLLARTYRREITHSAEREENPWRQALERALDLDPSFHRLRVELARYHLQRFANLTRAEEILRPALASEEPPSAALDLQAKILEARHGEAAAARLSRRLAERLEGELLLPVRLREIDRAREEGRIEEAQSLVDAGLTHSPTSPSLLRRRKALLLGAGDEAGARRQLAILHEASPLDLNRLFDLADFDASREDWAAALQAIDRALIIAPDDEEAHRRRGDLLLLLGRGDAALDALRRSLALEPNQPRLREYLDLLRPEVPPLEGEFRIPMEDAIAASLTREEAPEHAYRILLDNQAVEVHEDGTTGRFHQLIAKVLNDRGIRDLDVYSISYAHGEQWVKVLLARVHHPDGRTDEARIRNRDPQVREGEYPLWSSVWLDLPPLEVGDVVEIEYLRQDLRQSFFGDYFGDEVVFAGTLPRERSVYSVLAPEQKELFYHLIGPLPEPRIEIRDGKRLWRWDVADLGVIDPEPLMPPLREIAPAVQVSTYRDWDEFARWYHHLIRRQFEPSEAIREKVRELTAGLATPIERLRAIYDFVVTDVRYIAWEFGVHGFKPYNAATIFTRRFGDCKDKATLLCTMLDVAGIEAHPVLIRLTRQRPEEDFSLPIVSHFNHCIAYVPDPGDGEGLFLDGTAELHPADQLPMGDRGARVLVVREERGELRQIPWNRPDEQSVSEEVKVKVLLNGEAELEQHDKARGDFAVSLRSRFEIEGERASRLERAFGRRFPGTRVERVETSDLKDLSSPVELKVRLRIPDYLDGSGEGIKLPPLRDFFGATEFLGQSASRAERSRDLLLGNPRRSRLSIDIELPPGHEVSHLPADLDLESKHLRFRFRARQEGNRLRIERVLVTRSPRVPPEDYPAYKVLVDRIEQFRDKRILLRQTEEVQ